MKILKGISNLLTGLVFLIMGAGMMWLLYMLGQAIAQIGALGIAGASEAISSFGLVLSIGWVFSIIAILAGIANIILGLIILLRK